MPAIEKLRTTPTFAQWHTYVLFALDALGKPLTDKRSFALLWAMWAGETARGKSMWNYNFGNIMASNLASQNYVKLIAYNGKPITLRAYDDYPDGAKAWIGLLSKTGSGIVWKAVEAGDLDAFVAATKKVGYYEEPAEDYRKMMSPLYNEYIGTTPGETAPVITPEPSKNDGASILIPTIGVFTLGAIAWASQR